MTALAFLCALTTVLPATAQDTAQTVLADLTARHDVDSTTLAECDFLCKYRNETWTIHTRSYPGIRTPFGGEQRIPVFGIRADTAEGLSPLFPTNAFVAVASRLDPIALHLSLHDGNFRLLPPAKYGGVDCKVLLMDSMPLQTHVGTSYTLPAIENVAITLFVHEGRILRLIAQVTRKSAPDGVDPPLILETTPQYRHPKTGAARQIGPPLMAQFKLDGKTAWITNVAWSPDARTIACSTFSGGCWMLSAAGAKDIGTIPVLQRMTEAHYTPDGQFLVMPDPQGERIVYVVASTGKQSRSVPIDECGSLVISPDTAKVLVWDRRSRACLVECATGQIICDIATDRSKDAQFSNDGKLLAVLHDNRMEIKDTSNGHNLFVFPTRCGQRDESISARSWCMAFSPDAKLIALGDMSQGVSLYRLFDEEEHEPVRVYVYEVESGKLVKTLTGMNGAVKALQFSPDGSLLAVGDADDRGEAPGENAAVLLWETKLWKPLAPVAVQPQSAIACMQFSPDGKSLATVAERAASVEIWRLPDH